jgi:hypothetical protein
MWTDGFQQVSFGQGASCRGLGPPIRKRCAPNPIRLPKPRQMKPDPAAIAVTKGPAIVHKITEKFA